MELLLFTIFAVVCLVVMLLAPHDEAAYRRHYIGSIFVNYDGDNNPFSSQTRYLGVERSAYHVYVGNWGRRLTNTERKLSDDELIALIQRTF